MGQKLVGWVCPFSEGSWVPIEQKVVWAEAYLHTKWHLSPSNSLATTDMAENWGFAPLGRGSWVPI